MQNPRDKLYFFTIPPQSRGRSPLAAESVQAGFPSPADDYLEEPLDLNSYCVKNPPATFFVRVEGDSMVNIGISKGDLVVVDRSVEVKSNDIIIAVLNGEFTLKRIIFSSKSRIFLRPENQAYSAIEITEDQEFEVWGKVTRVIHEL